MKTTTDIKADIAGIRTRLARKNVSAVDLADRDRALYLCDAAERAIDAYGNLDAGRRYAWSAELAAAQVR